MKTVMMTLPSLESVLEKGFEYNNGKGHLNFKNSAKTFGNMPCGMLGSNLNTLGEIKEAELRAYNLRQDREKENQHTLYGDVNNAIIHQPLNCFQNDGGQKGGIDYHHHNNFNTKDGGYGGYMNLNIGGNAVEKTTMNGQQFDLRNTSLQEQAKLKESSTWLTQQGNIERERLAQNFLNNFNNSDAFKPKNIKKNDLMSIFGK